MSAEKSTSAGGRLRAAIAAAGYRTVADFAAAAGMNPVTVRAHIQRDSIPKKAAAIYARRLAPAGVTTAWLLFGAGEAPDGMPAAPPPGNVVSPRAILDALSALTLVVGEVVDEAVVRFYDTDEARTLLTALPSPAQQKQPYMFGLVVETEQLRPRYRAGDLLFMLSGHYEKDWHRYANTECLVQPVGAPCMLRHILHAATPDRATLTTLTGVDVENARIDWVVPVTWVRRLARPRPSSPRLAARLESDKWTEALTRRPSAPFMSDNEVRALARAGTRKATH